MRHATSTRRDYEGRKLMGNLARWLMREVKGLGYRGINIECVNDAVHHVWANAPAPFRSEIVAMTNLGKYTEEIMNGEVRIVHPFAPSVQNMSKIYVNL